jgi:hypothetical protein
MVLMGDRVPMYKQQANRGLLWLAALILVIGGLISLYLFNEDAYLSQNSRGIFAGLVTVILSLFLVIAATARFWFRHLWHHRPGYKRG